MTGRLSAYLWALCRKSRLFPIGVSLFLLAGLKPVAPTAQVIQPPPPPCVCTPLLMNTNPAGSHTWFVRAKGGNLTLTVFGRAVNSTDPSTVTAQVFDGGGGFVGSATVSYPAGQTPGAEFLSAVPVIAAAPGAVYRIEVTTPGAPGTQAHFRLAADGADWMATNSPSTPSFEEGHVRWLLSVGAGEPLDVLVSILGTPAAATTVHYRWIGPTGPPGPSLSATVLDPSVPAMLSVPTPAAGWWTLDLHATDHYTLNKIGGADLRTYVDWQSAGEATLSGTVTFNGVPNTVPVGVEVRDARTGDLMAAYPAVTNALPATKLISGDYVIHVVVPPGVNPVPDIPVHLECNKALSILVALTGTAQPPPPRRRTSS